MLELCLEGLVSIVSVQERKRTPGKRIVITNAEWEQKGGRCSQKVGGGHIVRSLVCMTLWEELGLVMVHADE